MSTPNHRVNPNPQIAIIGTCSVAGFDLRQAICSVPEKHEQSFFGIGGRISSTYPVSKDQSPLNGQKITDVRSTIKDERTRKTEFQRCPIVILTTGNAIHDAEKFEDELQKLSELKEQIEKYRPNVRIFLYTPQIITREGEKKDQLCNALGLSENDLFHGGSDEAGHRLLDLEAALSKRLIAQPTFSIMSSTYQKVGDCNPDEESDTREHKIENLNQRRVQYNKDPSDENLKAYVLELVRPRKMSGFGGNPQGKTASFKAFIEEICQTGDLQKEKKIELLKKIQDILEKNHQKSTPANPKNPNNYNQGIQFVTDQTAQLSPNRRHGL